MRTTYKEQHMSARIITYIEVLEDLRKLMQIKIVIINVFNESK